MSEARAPFIIGWEEWVAMPDLGLPAIKAKIDTGAKTSALHAFVVEPYGSPEAPMVRFGVHPVPGREDIEIFRTAPVVDRREVTSSNGERELRVVIATCVAMGSREWPIEITLTNRETMSYRMLLGRQAIPPDVLVDVATSFRQPRLSHNLYRRPADGRRAEPEPGDRALRIAILTRQPLSPSNRRLRAAVERQGHAAEMLDPARLALSLAAGGQPSAPGGSTPVRFDAVILRTRPGPYATAIVRGLEQGGALALNPAYSLDRLRDPLATLQTLAQAGLPLPFARLEPRRWRDAWRLAGAQLPRLSVLVLGRRSIRALWYRDAGSIPAELPTVRSQCALAEQASAALGLGLAAVDLSPGDAGPAIVAVTAAPLMAAFEKGARDRIAPSIVAEIAALAGAGSGRDIAGN